MFNLVSRQYRQSGKRVHSSTSSNAGALLLLGSSAGSLRVHCPRRAIHMHKHAYTQTHLCLCVCGMPGFGCGKKLRVAAKAITESRCASHRTSRPHTHSAPLRDHSVSLLLAQEFHYSSPKFLESENLCQPLLTFYLGPRTHTLAHTRTHGALLPVLTQA